MNHWIGLGGGAVLGALVGSYCATILLRWPQGEGAAFGRSRCDSCAAPLGPGALVPIVSYLRQRGRCTRCGARIPRDHLRIELGAAAIGGLSGLLFAAQLGAALATAAFGWILLSLAAFDLRHFWLPDRLTLPLAALGLLVNGLLAGPGLASALIGAAAGFIGLQLAAWTYRAIRGREGLGGGDPKLLGAIGAWVGWQALPLTLFAAAMLGLGAAALLGLRGGSLAATTRLPFGAALAAAAWPLWIWLLLGGDPLGLGLGAIG